MAVDNSIQVWRRAGKHLPKFLRDFHAAKDVFRAMHEMTGIDDAEQLPGQRPISWSAGQVYAIDCFLWFLARHGYTIQKTAAKLPFEDLEASVAACTRRRNAAFSQMLTQGEEGTPAKGAQQA